jgi:hypothetical protein
VGEKEMTDFTITELRCLAVAGFELYETLNGVHRHLMSAGHVTLCGHVVFPPGPGELHPPRMCVECSHVAMSLFPEMRSRRA